MGAEYALLLQIIRSRMLGTDLVIPDNTDYARLVQIAREHKLTPFIAEALSDVALPPQTQQSLQFFHSKSVFRDVQFDHVQQQIRQALEAAGIEHVFMRGICLKHDYPHSALRTMSDMDVLVHTKDLPKVSRAMVGAGATATVSDGNHRNFEFPPGVEVEFHPMLVHCSCPVGTGLNPGWQYVPKDQPGVCKQMTPEGFYLNVMGHFATHFFSAGAGIRFVLDIWVCRHLRQPQPDRGFVEQELERVGLLDFAKNVEQLADCWMSDAPVPEHLQEMEQYILSSGLHGHEQRAMLNAMCFAPRKNAASALLKKVFYPKEDLENRFDWAVGRPWLRIPAWFARVYLALTTHGDRIGRWEKGTRRISAEQVARQQEQLRRFGVGFKENG